MAELGRPKIIDKYMLGKIEQAARRGLNNEQISLSVGINPDTLYEYLKNNPDFSVRFDLLKNSVLIKARENIADAIQDKDGDTSRWYLERRDKDFKPKQETENTGTINVNVINFADKK